MLPKRMLWKAERAFGSKGFAGLGAMQCPAPSDQHSTRPIRPPACFFCAQHKEKGISFEKTTCQFCTCRTQCGEHGCTYGTRSAECFEPSFCKVGTAFPNIRVSIDGGCMQLCVRMFSLKAVCPSSPLRHRYGESTDEEAFLYTDGRAVYKTKCGVLCFVSM